MHTSKRIFVLASTFAVLTSCTTSSHRDPASTDVNDTTLSGTRVNPVRYTLAPKWKIRLHDGEKSDWADDGKLNWVSYEIGTEKGFRDFKNRIEELRTLNETSAKAHKKGKGIFSKGSVMALDEISTLISLIESRQLTERDQVDAFQHIAELASSFSFAFEYPIPPKLFILAAPLRIAAEFANKPMDKDAGPAVNVASVGVQDLSLVDPANSTFWQYPGEISSKDMYLGFNRSKLPEFKTPCKYEEPKTSYGVHPGIVVKCDGKKWKFKFGNETKTEPFSSRLAWALGYNAIPVDYVKISYIEYDRKLISEFNSRKEFGTRLTSGLGFDITTIKMQKYYDPFSEALAGAILKDGSSVNAITLKNNLLKKQSAESEEKDENYNVDYESKIRYLVLKEASAEPSTNDNEKNIGPWSWNDLDHPNRRETRGFTIFAAFLNLFDARTDNNKIRFVKEDGRTQMKHYVSDLGSGLGLGSDLLHQFNGDPNGYPWEIIRAIREAQDNSPLTRSSGAARRNERLIEGYAFKGYSVIMENESFNRARAEDARWLVRRLAKFSEAQFQDALIAAGWSAAEVRIYLEKFASRRDNLVKVFELDKEIPLSRPQGANRKLHFDPLAAHALAVSSQPNITAPVNGKKVVNGLVVTQ